MEEQTRIGALSKKSRLEKIELAQRRAGSKRSRLVEVHSRRRAGSKSSRLKQEQARRRAGWERSRLKQKQS